MPEEWPFNGEFVPAAERKFEPVVLMVPFFKGRKINLKRHAQFLNNIGFDVVVFDLHPTPKKLSDSLVSSTGSVGMKAIWTDQVEKLLNEIPGKKIVFSFSNPSAAAIAALARRNAWDVLGLICDGGPSADLWQSMINYYTVEEPKPTWAEKALRATLMSALWSPRFLWDLKEDVQKLPKNFPILSIRGWKDPLIPPHLIDPVFDVNPDLNLQKLALPEAVHLNGLKDFPKEYEPPVAKFLKSISEIT